MANLEIQDNREEAEYLINKMEHMFWFSRAKMRYRNRIAADYYRGTEW